MYLNDYQDKAATTAVYPDEHQIAYPALGLVEEVGELLSTDPADVDAMAKELGDVCWYTSQVAYDLGLRLQNCKENASKNALVSDVRGLYDNSIWVAGRVKKILRGDNGREEKVLDIQGYLGDILLRVDGIAKSFDSSLSEILETNIDKLFDRKDRGVIKGDGDNR